MSTGEFINLEDPKTYVFVIFVVEIVFACFGVISKR